MQRAASSAWLHVMPRCCLVLRNAERSAEPSFRQQAASWSASEKVHGSTFLYSDAIFCVCVTLGHDTTASAISWTLYSLAEHQEHQTLCQQEIDSILDGRSDDTVEWYDKKKQITSRFQKRYLAEFRVTDQSLWRARRKSSWKQGFVHFAYLTWYI